MCRVHTRQNYYPWHNMWRPYCNKTCLVGLLIRSIFRGEKCTSASARVHFFPRKIERINRPTRYTYFALITHLLSIRATPSWKMLMNNKFRPQTLTGNPTGNYRCQILASRALNMSCSFSQSARSIQSRCVIITIILLLTFCIRHFGMHLRDGKVLRFDSNYPEWGSQRPDSQ